jgi:predicted Zn-ribbon and HTH transcriptional regulator
MSRKSPNLTLSLPKCRHCGRHWRPVRGVVAAVAFCPKCSAERKAIASAKLGLKKITGSDLTGSYLLPRGLRPR